jgi:hypothetical protein
LKKPFSLLTRAFWNLYAISIAHTPNNRDKLASCGAAGRLIWKIVTCACSYIQNPARLVQRGSAQFTVEPGGTPQNLSVFFAAPIKMVKTITTAHSAGIKTHSSDIIWWIISIRSHSLYFRTVSVSRRVLGYWNVSQTWISLQWYEAAYLIVGQHPMAIAVRVISPIVFEAVVVDGRQEGRIGAHNGGNRRGSA